MQSIIDIVNAFDIDKKVYVVEPFGSGHINNTFRVTVSENKEPAFILQKVNISVFPDVAQLTANIFKVLRHISKKNHDYSMMQPIVTKAGNYYVTSDDGEVWRMFTYIPDSISVDLVTNSKQAEQSGKAYGWFINSLSDFHPSEIFEIIPRFHCLNTRINQLKQAQDFNIANRLQNCGIEVDFYLSRYDFMAQFFAKIGSDAIPVRITHNDTKVNNVLFTSEWDVISVIDLDTVMPGVVHFDYGDSVRTIASKALEDESDMLSVGVSLTLLESFTKGFLSQLSTNLTEEEIDNLWLAPMYMTYIMGIRFLADYLRGDNYYKTKFSEHNLLRARNQMALLIDLEKNASNIKSIINKYK